jgi:hypothetical protein
MEKIWMKDSCSTFRRSFCVEVSKLSDYSVSVLMFQPGFSLIQSQKTQIGTFVFLFFMLLRSIVSTGQKEMRQIRKLRTVDYECARFVRETLHPPASNMNNTAKASIDESGGYIHRPINIVLG